MFLSYLTLFTALAISSVAIWYSVAGLAAIFAAAVVPIIIMGGTLEVAKLVTAVWLHRYWHQATWWLKTYLVAAVLVLMFITSMGIFGFLSNAHVQQTAQGDNVTAQLERIESEIARQEAIISRAEDKIETATTEGVGADSNIQSQIDREQARIDRAYERAEPAIQEQRDIIERQEGRILDQIEAVDSDTERLDTALAQGEVALAQSIIGVESDGILGPNTRQAIQEFRNRKAEEKAVLEQRLSAVGNDPRVQAARQEIERIRNRVEQEVAQSNELINRLRAQLGTSTGEDIDAVIDEQNTRIAQASQEIDILTQEKFEIESKVRQLEAEVGPIKYIAEFVYGEDADKNLLEEAVRWVIVIIIFVFDPLAVLLLIASQYTFRWHGKDFFEYVVPDSDSKKDKEDANDESLDNSEVELDNNNNNKDTNYYSGSYSGEAVNYVPQNYTVDYDTVYSDVYHNRTVSNYDSDFSVKSVDDGETEKFYTINNKENPTEHINESTEEPHELSTGYVEYKNKRYTKDVFQRLYPEFQLQSDDDAIETNAGFGTKFPDNPGKGDLFLRVDYLPTRLFKWNGQKWISVDKEHTDQYAYQDAYIDHLIEKISSGEYDPEMLTELEREQLEERLKSK